MAKMNRMRLSEFKSYIFFLSTPLIIISGVLLYKPSVFFLLGITTGLPALPWSQASADPSLTDLVYIRSAFLPLRIAAFSLLFFALVLLNIRNNPGNNREIFLWMSLYMLGIAGLLISAPFFGTLNWLAIPLGIYFLMIFVFLFAYASRNLIVRE
jgi:hypothetical protein